MVEETSFLLPPRFILWSSAKEADNFWAIFIVAEVPLQAGFLITRA